MKLFALPSSIRARLLLATTLTQVLLLSLMLVNSARLMDAATTLDVDARMNRMAAMLNIVVTAYGEAEQFPVLQDIFTELLQDSGDGLKYVVIGRQDGTILLHTGDDDLARLMALTSPDHASTPLHDGDMVHMRKSLLLPGYEVGFLQFGLSNAHGNQVRAQVLNYSAWIAVALVLATLLLLSLLAFWLTRNLRELMDGSEAFAAGQLDHRIEVRGHDELSKLAERFNSMATALQARINDLEQITQRLTVSEERYALAMRGANDGLWDWDISHGTIFIAPRFRAIASIPEGQTPPLGDYGLLDIHPDDRSDYRALLVRHLKGRSSQFEYEFRIRICSSHSGERIEWRWIHARGLALRHPLTHRAYRMAGSITDIDARKRTEARRLHESFHDSLTELPNRSLFIEHLDNALARRARDPALLFAVVAINLGRFHVVNDSYGHATGDRVIHAVAERIRAVLRSGDIAARVGGDQFAMLINDLPDDDTALSVAHVLRDALVKPFDLGGHVYYPSTRIGIVYSGDASDDAEAMLRDADNALHRGTHDSINIFHASMHTQMLRALQLESALRRAIAEDALSIRLQPIVALGDASIVSFEALARWHEPAQPPQPPQPVSPAEFVPLAEMLGLIHDLFLSVLHQVHATLTDWQRRAGGNGKVPTISVNLSASQLVRPRLVEEVMHIIAGFGLPPQLIRFEITEGALAQNLADATRVMQQFRAHGIHILIDDFGTGYSSLNYLHTLPCDTIKLDGAFTRAIDNNERVHAVVRRTIELAHDLKLNVVAECIENPAQADALRAMRCDFGQGYLFNPPLDIDAATRLIFPDD